MVAFFGLLSLANTVQAHRKKERTYYIGAMIGFLMLLASLFFIFNQFLFGLVLFATAGILAIAGLPKIMRMLGRESAKQLQEMDPSAPLRGRDFLTWKGWFKLASSWGVRKTMCFYSIIMTMVSGATLFALSILGMISIMWAIGFTIIVGILSPIYFYRQVGKALK